MLKTNVELSGFPRGGAIHNGVRCVLIGLNSFLLIAGIIMITLGVKLTEYTDTVTSPSTRPDIWWLGLTPLTIGLVGIVCTSIGHPKLLLAWLLYTPLITVASFVFFVRRGCFNHAPYGVTMRIYGVCEQLKNVCVCLLSSRVVSISHHQSCDTIRYVTSVYLSQILLMTSVLATSIIGCFLAFVTICCRKFCILQHEEGQPLLMTTIQRTPSSLYRSQEPTTYMTDFIPKRKLRTYLPGHKHNRNTML